MSVAKSTRTTPERRRRLSVTICLCGLLVAASAASLFPVSHAQQRKNRIRWMALPTYERDRMRELWEGFEQQAVDVQHQVMRRVATLGRLQEQRSLQLEGRRSAEEVERVLQAMAERLERLLDGGELASEPVSGSGPMSGASEASLADRIREQTRLRIDAFLDNLVEAERLSVARRTELRGLSWDEFVRHALEMQKDEEIFLYSEVSRSAQTTYDELAPLDVVEEMLDIRRLRGFLGEAGEVLGLTEEEQHRLALASDEDFFRVAKHLMEPKARKYMSDHFEMNEEQIDRVLSRPYRQLERSLHRLVRESKR